MADGASAETLEMLQQRVKRQENLLQRCKKTIQSHKEQCTLLTSEKEALQEQLDESLQVAAPHFRCNQNHYVILFY